MAHNGCCLTVTEINGDRVSFDLVKETLRITNLGDLQPGDVVNIERAAKFSDEIGGHLMSGHIMTTAEICKIINAENNREIWFKPQDSSLLKYILHKGFIGIDGISLTVGDVTKTKFCVHLIPETLARTTLGAKSWDIASILRSIRIPGRLSIPLNAYWRSAKRPVLRVGLTTPPTRTRNARRKTGNRIACFYALRRGWQLVRHAQAAFHATAKDHLPELNIARAEGPGTGVQIIGEHTLKALAIFRFQLRPCL